MHLYQFPKLLHAPDHMCIVSSLAKLCMHILLFLLNPGRFRFRLNK